MDRLSSLLPKVVSKYDLDESSFASLVLLKTKEYAVQTWGDHSLKSISIKKYTQGNLYLYCNNASWSQELYFHKESLKNFLQQHFPKIKTLTIKILQKKSS